MDSPSISYVRRNRQKIVSSINVGGEILSKLMESALADGVRSLDVYSGEGIYAISGDKPWLVKQAFEELIPYPTLAVNSARFEILVSAFADWFWVQDAAGESYSYGARPGQAVDVLSALRYPFALAFGLGLPAPE